MAAYVERAYRLAMKSTCLDKHVGAVLVQEGGGIVDGAYNTTLCCNECVKQNDAPCPATHAEINLLKCIRASGYIVRPTDFVVCTYEPCTKCLEAMNEAGIKTVCYIEGKDGKIGEHNGVTLIRITDNKLPSLSRLAQKISLFHSAIGWPKRFKEPLEQTEEAQILLLALYQEVGEVVDSLKWKPWRPNYGKSVPIYHLKEELADIFFFWCSIMECFGITVHDMERIIGEKLEKNYNRQTEKRQ